ncbi:VOC family protein [uncultured Mucilaginibacter sp.]|uniref:VOC family protein n=1 Tax=uncultured Mucilaginibacter sp. TaxID=797541 RepID=UPI0025E1E11D|nr:VOC family protein [uncultured Mucilaginibacter sp.]
MQKITPFLWFDGNAEEAVDFYASVFKNSVIVSKDRAGNSGGPWPAGSLISATLEIDSNRFILFNGGPLYRFSPATSLYVNCETQEEVDALWDKLSEGGKPNRCGWLDDKFGVTWQIVPSALPKLMNDKDRAKAGRVIQAMMKMGKIIIAELQKAYDGE